ncbi:concanavalin A-like lectin/glucanase domain-containing protein [Phascolomyces articulosus]|uniref:Concanavalin A-like lectin/glucanase domain-containing protein n=1 Tax=Phascolomyces articulosus TaxID=60185 RepID=A0AAD5PCA5_9FUNG|nr:concanavalin A-like lectin/glucanase domain-containing protein [Phascolomyces articulosus]
MYYFLKPFVKVDTFYHLPLLLLSSLFLVLVYGSPVLHENIVSQHCDQRYNKTLGNYELHNNILDSAKGYGTQCIEGEAKGKDGISWKTAWSWKDSSTFKSFPHIEYIWDEGQAFYFNNIKSIPFTWDWSYEDVPAPINTGKDDDKKGGKAKEDEPLKATVSFELLTYSLETRQVDFQIRIWFGLFGDVDTLGEEVVGTPTFKHEDGIEWKLYKGANNKLTIFTLVPKDKEEIVSLYHDDALPYYNYLVEHGHIPWDAPKGLFKIRAGSQTYAGSKKQFITHFFSINLEQ